MTPGRYMGSLVEAQLKKHKFQEQQKFNKKRKRGRLPVNIDQFNRVQMIQSYVGLPLPGLPLPGLGKPSFKK